MPPKFYVRSDSVDKGPINREPIDALEANIIASPYSSSDEEDRAPIKHTLFRRGPEEQEKSAKTNKISAGGTMAKKETVNGKDTRRAKAVISPSSSSGLSNVKRKDLADPFLGKSMFDPFGRVNQNKRRVKAKYGLIDQSRLPSNQSALASTKNRSFPPASPKGSNSFRVPDAFDSPMKSQSTQSSPRRQGFFKPDAIEGTPTKSVMLAGRFVVPDGLSHTPISTPGAKGGFRDPGEVEVQVSSDPNGGGSFTDFDIFAGTAPSSSPSTEGIFQRPANGLKRDAKKLFQLKKRDLGEELACKVQNIIGQDGHDLGVDAMDLFDNDSSVSTEAIICCPMCGHQCDAAELKKWGSMDTRKQERFCRSHRKTTAEEKWSSKGYPEIDWEKLDLRISEHHDFIEGLLNGADCHYRKTFEEMVAAGKGRSLRKLESNLTPGYYGSRGLNTISEHVIREFSKLLSERSLKDPLISKRGTTAFVQSVIVPELAVRLMMDDLSVDDVQARDVLTESANMGELVNEEIRDVVVEQAENSEDDEDED